MEAIGKMQEVIITWSVERESRGSAQTDADISLDFVSSPLQVHRPRSPEPVVLGQRGLGTYRTYPFTPNSTAHAPLTSF